jgi:hypothetical protein
MTHILNESSSLVAKKAPGKLIFIIGLLFYALSGACLREYTTRQKPEWVSAQNTTSHERLCFSHLHRSDSEALPSLRAALTDATPPPGLPNWTDTLCLGAPSLRAWPGSFCAGCSNCTLHRNSQATCEVRELPGRGCRSNSGARGVVWHLSLQPTRKLHPSPMSVK